MSYTRTDVDALQSRVRTMLQRGTVKSVDDAMMMQILDLDMKRGHAPTRVEHWHPYGISMHPQTGSEVIVAALGGNQDHMIVLGTADRRYRLKVAAGEMAIHDDQGQKVHLMRDAVFVETSKKVVAKAPLVLVGEDNPGLPRVMTEAGPSNVLRAKV